MTKITGKILVISEKDEIGSILEFVLDFENTKFNKKIIDEINQKNKTYRLYYFLCKKLNEIS